ncbi:hypothetical protein [Jeotgalibacillus haloalkalitolerans]|uniref:Uncharacterized protein n=1 Tax=Jeotgalibacillus haloalkalitolerans TaxID=3104292 RepID=A0ABU5KLW2_9BACL|nr:hypothetical protein [Jeotgalibacillus sp. HH7-29]MDZ5712252.1 hypothetical protein [Jeotgalibacillus sp. HH7-29]
MSKKLVIYFTGGESITVNDKNPNDIMEMIINSNHYNFIEIKPDLVINKENISYMKIKSYGTTVLK